MTDTLAARLFRQFVSYFFVGGIAALTEWICYYFFDSVAGISYIISTILSFLIATAVNYALGKRTTFRDSKAELSKAKELASIYAVSAMGLLLNVILMFIFVQTMHLPGLLSKIISTGIVFFWNFLSRKFWVYKI